MDRLADCYNRLNTCPMGAAALATTRFPLNRQRMAELLGFEKVHEHAYDAISAKDFILEYLFSLAMTVSDLGRITESLLYWNTYEFGMIELSDEFTSFSTIMPQKKNPVALETIRAMAPIITGKLFNAFGILKAEPWSNGRETTILDDDYLETGGTVRNLAVLMSSIIKTLRVNDERMLELAKRGFSTATDLADILVSENYFPFRTAHEIVGLCVKKAISQGLDSTGITSEMVEGCIEEHLGRNMPISKDLVRKAMDPRFCVQARNLAGGSAPEEAERMIQERSITLRNKQSIIQALRERLESAKQELQNEASRFLAMVQK
jgi:argininosuccinate lyase